MQKSRLTNRTHRMLRLVQAGPAWGGHVCHRDCDTCPSDHADHTNHKFNIDDTLNTAMCCVDKYTVTVTVTETYLSFSDA